MVLLGCYLTAHLYDDFAPKLTDRFHLYGMTRPGIGASEKPSTGYTVQRSEDNVLEVLDGLKLKKPILTLTPADYEVRFADPVQLPPSISPPPRRIIARSRQINRAATRSRRRLY